MGVHVDAFRAPLIVNDEILDPAEFTTIGTPAVIDGDGIGDLCAPPPPPPCPADFNHDGTLDPDDLADFIGCYFDAPPCAAPDFNSDGSSDPDDLSDYIGASFARCG